MNTDKKIKGSAINGYIGYVKSRWGAEGLSSLGEHLDMDLDTISENGWYDAVLVTNIYDFLAGRGPDHVKLAGRYVIQNLGVLSYLARFVNIKTFLKKAPKSYSDVFNYGSCAVEMDDKSALVKLKGIKINKYTCELWQGVLEGMLETTRTNGTVKPVSPPEREDNDCFFQLRWE